LYETNDSVVYIGGLLRWLGVLGDIRYGGTGETG
jgi:hypothetical protein